MGIIYSAVFQGPDDNWHQVFGCREHINHYREMQEFGDIKKLAICEVGQKVCGFCWVEAQEGNCGEH